MPRKKLPKGEKLEKLTIYIQGKHLEGQDLDELRRVLHEKALKYITLSKPKIQT